MKKGRKTKVSSSFRDPSGFVYTEGNEIFRQINKNYKENYELLNSSGLYQELVNQNLLIEHKETSNKPEREDGWKIISPKKIDFISHPYEWTFSMLKDAALLTLEVQKKAVQHGMSLKDASAFNVQFVEGKPILIDTLSFEKYEEGKPWVAYKQFVEHFLAPLNLMSLVDIRLGRLSSLFIDGVPVELASKILPFKSRFNLNLLIHIHAHAASKKRFSDKKLSTSIKSKRFSKRALLGLVDSLEGSINKLEWNPKGTQWEDYYEEDKNNYKTEAFRHKADLTKKFITECKAKEVWDLGANTGHFSRILGEKINVVAFDSDYGVLELNYRKMKKEKEKNILPLFSDLANPSPSLGWAEEERQSLVNRGPADAVLALALIHHLAISNNVPFSNIASFFAKIGKYLIIEFVEKSDSQVQKLLANRVDIFNDYNKKEFEEAFSEFFKLKRIVPIKNSKRTLYLMQRSF